MSATPRVYRWDDVDAPVTSSKNNALYEILKPCLVDGYGAQPAAGWDVVYDVWSTDGVCTFTNAGQSGVLGLVLATQSTAYGASLFVADAMVDATTAVRARSSYKAITDLQAIGASWTSYSCQTSYGNKWQYWVVIANEHFALVYFVDSPSFIEYSGASHSWSYFELMLFGSMSSVRSLGGVSDPAVNNFCLHACKGTQSGTGMEDGVSVLLADENGSPVDGDFYGSLYPWKSLTIDNAGRGVNGAAETYFYPVEVWGGTSSSISGQYQLGKLPMCFMSNQLLGTSRNSLADELAPARLNELIELNGRSGYLINMPDNGGFMFVSMELEDWL